MNPQDNPLFTTYALGELDLGQAHEIHEQLSSNSAAAHELEQIEAVTDALRHTAPLPTTRLTPEQRHAVLHPTNLPRRIQPMMPRQVVRKPEPMFWSSVSRVLKAAAVITLTGAAFFAGWRMQPEALVAVKAPETPNPANTPSKTETKPVIAEAPKPAVKAESVTVMTIPAPVTTVEKAPIIEVPKKTEAVATIVANVPKSTPTVAPFSLGFTMPSGSAASFANTTRQAGGQFSLQPSLLRPVLPKLQDQAALASPLKTPAKTSDKPQKTPDLFIHSWKSEVAACPWNPANRLLRIVIQLPADQAAVTGVTRAEYPIQISFDPLTVKQFRLLCERHLAATELRTAGTHVIWYEFQPNGQPADFARGSSRQIAAVTVPNAHFTSQTVGPFDSSKLQVIDRGYTLQNAREDFVFETSVLGFGLLMRGSEQLGNLNHALVLDLAKRAKGSEASSERTRFIKLVEDAQRAVGL